MKKIFFFALLLQGVLQQVAAQDAQFSQFYSSPLTLNPALTGAFDGKFRVSSIYRDQNQAVSQNPFKTFSTALDIKFDVNPRARMKDQMGVGITFMTDKTTGFDLNANSIMLSTSYIKALNQDNNQFLTLGLQGGVIQRNVNFGNLYFSDQFDGYTQYALPTYETFTDANNFAVPDLNVGLNYTLAPKRGTVIFIGGAIHHLFSPRVSFYKKKDTDERFAVFLEKKYSVQASAQLGKNGGFKFIPRVLWAVQGQHQQLSAGTDTRFIVNTYNGMAMHLGAWAHASRNLANPIGMEGVTALVGIEYSNFLIGISYDANLKSIASFGRRQGGIEFSFAYLGNYDNETILCPKF
jgi:type IX secretion system PorP/SprF family membrane protein